MLKHERFLYILQQLEQHQKVTPPELSEALDISEVTIRRDLTELDALGKIQKVHGGAVPVSGRAASFQQRQSIHTSAKQIIAEKAKALIKQDQVLMIDGGTTNLYLVQQLPLDLRATVVTNCLSIAQALGGYPRVQVIVPGGRYEKQNDVLVGADTVKAFSETYADLCFLGVCRIDAERGITADHYEEAQVKKTMIRSAKRAIALADIHKISQSDSFQVAPADLLSVLVTDVAPTDARLDPFRVFSITLL
ncbi:MAG: DeoR/GlpR family DNA-binding transcription regulator [Cyclobacteriaceae bacterium]